MWGGRIHKLLISRHKWTPYQPSLILVAKQLVQHVHDYMTRVCEPIQALVSILVLLYLMHSTRKAKYGHDLTNV